jgi:hypothetical protein
MATETVDIFNDNFSEDSFSNREEESEYVGDDKNNLELIQDGGKRHSTPTSSRDHSPSPSSSSSSSSKDAHKHTHTTSELTVIKVDSDSDSKPTISSNPVYQREQEEKKDDEDISTENESENEKEESDDESESSTIDQLSRDPLFLVLSQYLSNKDGNIVDALYKINKTLKKILAKMQ